MQVSVTPTPAAAGAEAGAEAGAAAAVAADPIPAVVADRFSFWYGASQALRDISLAVPPRRVIALIGPSGCGKTTLLRCVNRMDDLVPDTRHAGDLRVGGRSVYDPRLDLVALRRRVGMVFQRSTPFPKSVRDNVAYGVRVNGLATRRQELDATVESALRRVALWDEVKDRLGTSALVLSHGQQQRLCIARALAVRPEVLLLDEPASALDPIATGRIEELIYALKDEYTVVVVTHNLQQAARVSDLTAFLLAGRVVEVGATDQLFTNPRDPQTEAYITGRFG